LKKIHDYAKNVGSRVFELQLSEEPDPYGKIENCFADKILPFLAEAYDRGENVLL